MILILSTKDNRRISALGRHPKYQVHLITLSFNSSNSHWNLMNFRHLQYFFEIEKEREVFHLNKLKKIDI